MIRFPIERVVTDILSYSIQFVLGTDNMLVVVALPDRLAGSLVHLIDPFGGIHFEISNDLGQCHYSSLFPIVW